MEDTRIQDAARGLVCVGPDPRSPGDAFGRWRRMDGDDWMAFAGANEFPAGDSPLICESETTRGFSIVVVDAFGVHAAEYSEIGDELGTAEISNRVTALDFLTRFPDGATYVTVLATAAMGGNPDDFQDPRYTVDPEGKWIAGSPTDPIFGPGWAFVVYDASAAEACGGADVNGLSPAPWTRFAPRVFGSAS